MVMAFDLAGLSAKDLGALLKQAQQRKTLLEKRPSITKVRAQIVKYARANGYAIEELFGDTGKGSARRAAGKKAARAKRTSKVAPKYRNPANPEETWSGRGRQPRWLAALTAKGKKLEQFLIAP
jgi:DNA-binding protein H-NS